jgi:hypothetical protein
MPASEKSSMASRKAIIGLVFDRPESWSMSSTMRPLRRMARMQAKVPSVMAR